MTVHAYVIEGRVEIADNPSSVGGVGDPPSDDGARWRAAMRDEAFVRDQQEFLDLAGDADADLLAD